jgi:hypothetical protein
MSIPTWRVGSGVPDIDADVAAVVLVFSRAEVEQLRSGRAVDDLMQLSDNARLRVQLGHGLYFSFDGYDSDPREVHQIPECQRYLQAIHEQWPYWMHFLAPEPGLWAVMLLGLTGGGTPVGAQAGRVGHSVESEQLHGVVNRMLLAMNVLHSQMNMRVSDRMLHFQASMEAIEKAFR